MRKLLSRAYVCINSKSSRRQIHELWRNHYESNDLSRERHNELIPENDLRSKNDLSPDFSYKYPPSSFIQGIGFPRRRSAAIFNLETLLQFPKALQHPNLLHPRNRNQIQREINIFHRKPINDFNRLIGSYLWNRSISLLWTNFIPIPSDIPRVVVIKELYSKVLYRDCNRSYNKRYKVDVGSLTPNHYKIVVSLLLHFFPHFPFYFLLFPF